MVRFVRQGKTLIIQLSGELLFTNASEIKEKIKAQIQSSDERLVLDLSELEFIDSSGVGVIISLLRRMEGERVIIASPQPKVARVFEITRLEKIVPIYATLEEALKG